MLIEYTAREYIYTNMYVQCTYMYVCICYDPWRAAQVFSNVQAANYVLQMQIYLHGA